MPGDPFGGAIVQGTGVVDFSSLSQCGQPVVQVVLFFQFLLSKPWNIATFQHCRPQGWTVSFEWQLSSNDIMMSLAAWVKKSEWLWSEVRVTAMLPKMCAGLQRKSLCQVQDNGGRDDRTRWNQSQSFDSNFLQHYHKVLDFVQHNQQDQHDRIDLRSVISGAHSEVW